MEFPIITATTAALILALQQLLMLSVGMYRTKLKVGVGTAGDDTLERRIRRHANLAENAALYLVALGLLELATGPGLPVLIFAGAFLLARAMHAVAFSSLAGSHLAGGGGVFLVFRAAGAFLTAIGGIALAAYLVYSLMPLS